MTDLEMDLMIAQARIKQLEKELAEKTPTVEEAIATISSYCKMQDTCINCIFFDEASDTCGFALNDLPCDWPMDGGSDG